MKKKKWITIAGSVLLAAAMMTGCGSTPEKPEKTVQTNKQTETAGGETQAEETGAIKETEAPETEPVQTEAPETTAPDDTEEYIDNPAAPGGEGDTNGFYDDAGTWITVYKNSNGDWVDESGMIYTFGDDGVTDQNGVFYPY